MPLDKPEDFGTDSTGYRINDYCRHCYQLGAFTNPGIPMERMIDRCAEIMGQGGTTAEADAGALPKDVMPRLKRWRTGASAEALRKAGVHEFAGDADC